MKNHPMAISAEARQISQHRVCLGEVGFMKCVANPSNPLISYGVTNG
jgi:hypothetical protein